MHAPAPHAVRIRDRRSARIAIVLLSVGMVVAGVGGMLLSKDRGAPVIVAAGDIACADNHRNYNDGEGTATECRQKHTSDLALSLDPDQVFVLGDGQYSSGSLRQYRAVYDKTWGRLKSVTRPTPGDHEYQSGSAEGYFEYFDVEPYYSFDIGSWHWVSLNSEVEHVPVAEQVQWLEEDLAATDKPCIGAFWGAVAFSSSKRGNNPAFRPFWEALHDAGADVVLGGDLHHYERFAKQAPDGTAASDGIRQFVVGTGGRSLYGFTKVQPNSEVRGKAFGVLELRLHDGGYDWRFHTESRGPLSDAGRDDCNP